MKRKIITIILFIIMIQGADVYAIETTNIINTQKESLNISSFIGETQNYTSDFLQDVDLNELLNAAITGNINNRKFLKNIWYILGQELGNSITALGSILIIIIINSIIKSLTDGLRE